VCELGHDALQRLTLRQSRRDHVAGPIGHECLSPTVGIELFGVGEIDATVVDSDAL
jgi:hypothetical protein